MSPSWQQPTALGLPENDRIVQLLADRATEGLDPEDRVELGQWLIDNPEVDALGFELAAAAADCAFASTAAPVPLPAALRAKVTADWQQRAALPATPSHRQGVAAVPGSNPGGVAPAGRGLWKPLGLAAALLLAVWVGWSLPERQPVPLSDVERRAELVATASDLVRWEWSGLGDPAFAAVVGEVVWSSERQDGYLTLRNLPSNDPAASQYQLWIVDPQRDEKHPVDGGVFDVTAASELVVRISAKLPVVDPSAFALTLEHPGGVVVSEGPLLTLAQR